MIEYSVASDKELEEVNAFFNRIHGSNRSMEQFRWQFRESPHGSGFHIVARGQNGEIAGIQAGMPTYFQKGEQRILTMKSEDTLVSPDHRGMGVFAAMYSSFIEECKRRKAAAIWGYTKAIKPFAKVGFDVPFHHAQSLIVFRPRRAYAYFSRLDPNGNLKKRAAIGAMIALAFVKRQLPRTHATTSINLTSRSGWTPIVQDSQDVFKIADDQNFIEWRLKQNPNWEDPIFIEIFSSDEVLLQCCFNIHENGIGYISHYRCFTTDLSLRSKAMAKAVARLRQIQPKIVACRDWTFEFNEANLSHIKALERAGWLSVKKGIGFVWMDFNETFDIQKLHLTRLSTEGVL